MWVSIEILDICFLLLPRSGFLTSLSFYDLLVFLAFGNPAFSELKVVLGGGRVLSIALFACTPNLFLPGTATSGPYHIH